MDTSIERQIHTYIGYFGTIVRNKWIASTLWEWNIRAVLIHSESVLAIVAKAVLVWLLLLVGIGKRRRSLGWASQVPYLVSIANSVLYLLECFFGLWVAVLVRVQLNGDLVVVLLNVLLALLSHSFDKQRKRGKQELVGQVHLIVWCDSLSTAILVGLDSVGFSLLETHLCIWRVEWVSLASLLSEILMGHLLGLFIQLPFLLLQEFFLVYSLLILHSRVEMLLFLLLHLNSFSIFKKFSLCFC